MNRHLVAILVFLLLAVSLTVDSHADGLIQKLPPTGHWSSYDVDTSITHTDGSQTNTTGILIVRALHSIERDGKHCRWIEFELDWEEKPKKENDRRFHSSITKVAVDESVFANHTDPIKGILAGFGANTSADVQPIKWTYQHPHALRPGLGSASGFGVVDHYLRSPFKCVTDLGREQIDVGDSTFECTGIETGETNHKIGSNAKSIISTAYRQWTCDKADFGVVKYHFERMAMDGVSFSQELRLKDFGDGAVSSLPGSQ